MYGALLADARKPTTRRARVQDVSHLARFLGVAGPADACALFVSNGLAGANAVVTGWVRAMLDDGLSPATVNRRVSTLRRLCKLARRFGLVAWALEVDGLKSRPMRDTSGPGRANWLKFLAAATRAAARGDAGKRDLAIIRLLHDHGLRRGELVSLDLADLDADAGRLLVTGKGRSEKTPVRLNAPTLLALSRWAEARGPAPGPLFTRLHRGRPRGGTPARLGGNALREVCAAISKRAGLARAVRPHGLRHEAITRVLELTGGNIVSAQRFARHSSPVTTQIYNDNRTDVASQMSRLLGEDG